MIEKPEPGDVEKTEATTNPRDIGETEKNLAAQAEKVTKPWWKRLLRM